MVSDIFSVTVAYLQGYMTCSLMKNALYIFFHPGLFFLSKIDSLSVIDDSKIYFPV